MAIKAHTKGKSRSKMRASSSSHRSSLKNLNVAQQTISASRAFVPITDLKLKIAKAKRLAFQHELKYYVHYYFTYFLLLMIVGSIVFLVFTSLANPENTYDVIPSEIPVMENVTEVALTVFYDSQCTTCADHIRMVSLIRQTLTVDLTVTYLDVRDSEFTSIVDEFDISYTPYFIFENTVVASKNFGLLYNSLEYKNGYYIVKKNVVDSLSKQ